MNSDTIRRVVLQTYGDVASYRNHTWHMAAALSYYFVLSLFPALMLLSAIVAYLPVPNLFDQALGLMARLLPSDSMGLIGRVLSDVITPNRKFVLSFGILPTVWTTSRGFAAAIEALNMAYDVRDVRPCWKTGPLAVGLALTNRLLNTGRTLSHGSGATVRRVARWQGSPFQFLRPTLAICPLDDCSRICRDGN
jgi:uncharacterized BrkB/YihY/UPF0761 family membrane protein